MPELPPCRLRFALFTIAIALLAGCEQPADETSPEPSYPTVRLLVVDDPEFATAIEREWQASGQPKIEITQATSQQVRESSSLAADCVIYPTPLMGDLATADKIVPLPHYALSGSEVNIGDVFPLTRLREISWGDSAIAVPFGSPQLVLLYRADLLERLELAPPKTWTEMVEVASRLDDPTILGESGELIDGWHPVAVPLGKGWASQLLLAWASASIYEPQRRDVLLDGQTMEPRIASEPFQHSLQQLAKLGDMVSPNCLEMSPPQATAELLAGRCAMAIGWLSPADAKRASSVQVAVAELPGVKDQSPTEPTRASLLSISGRVGSITSTARHTQGASNTLVWLASPSNAARLATQSPQTTLCRFSGMANAQVWVGPGISPTTARQYAEVVQRAKSREAWVMSLRLAGQHRYVEALDQAVQKAIKGEQAPSAALDQAADTWQRITVELGVDQQRESYLRSLCIEP